MRVTVTSPLSGFRQNITAQARKGVNCFHVLYNVFPGMHGNANVPVPVFLNATQ